MDTLLVLVGLSIFLAGTALYLSAALRKGSSWLFASLVFPPTVILFHARFWKKSHFSGYAQLIGLGLLVFGFLAGVQSHPEKYSYRGLRPIVNWLNERQSLPNENSIAQLGDVIGSIRENNGKLAGHIGATDFKLDRAEYLNGVLNFFDASNKQEISVFLGVDASQLPGQWSRLVQPDQLGPTIQVAATQSEVQSYTLGYKLNLRLRRVGDNTMAGNIELLIPDQRKSYIVGNFVAVTSEVRYRGGDVDRTLENEDTIFYVIKDYLKRNFAEQIMEVSSFSNVQRSYENGVQHAITTSVVKMADGQEHTFDIHTVKRETGWEVSENNTTQLLAAVHAMQIAPPAAAAKAKFKLDEKPIELDGPTFLNRSSSFIGEWMEMEIGGGLTQRGVLAGIDVNFVSLKPVGAGASADKAVLNIRRDDIVRVRIPKEK